MQTTQISGWPTTTCKRCCNFTLKGLLSSTWIRSGTTSWYTWTASWLHMELPSKNITSRPKPVLPFRKYLSFLLTRSLELGVSCYTSFTSITSRTRNARRWQWKTRQKTSNAWRMAWMWKWSCKRGFSGAFASLVFTTQRFVWTATRLNMLRWSTKRSTKSRQSSSCERTTSNDALNFCCWPVSMPTTTWSTKLTESLCSRSLPKLVSCCCRTSSLRTSQTARCSRSSTN